MPAVILDSNVIGGIAAASGDQQKDEFEKLERLRTSGARLVITPTIPDEIAAAYRSPSKIEKLIATVRATCQGVLSLGASEILTIEATEADPQAKLAAAPILPMEEIDLEGAMQSEDVKTFFENGGFGHKRLKHILEPLDRLAKTVAKDLSTFAAFVEARRHDCLDALVGDARGKGYLPDQEYDLDALWQRGAAWRFATLVYLANEFRRLTKTQQKGEGCMTDLRIVIEAAYSAEVRTRDGEFVACSELARQITAVPAVCTW
jgi:hypothetical protein